MIVSAFERAAIVLDACCVINLCASECMDAILLSLPTRAVVTAYVKDREVLNLRDSQTGGVRRINLDSQVVGGTLTVVAPESEVEKDRYITYASALGDDGEAMTAAIAVHRNWGIATDDRRAIAYLRQDAPQLAIATTPDILKHWADGCTPSHDMLREVLRKIRTGARYEPAKTHPLRSWRDLFAV
jgi:hypothetical protein